MATPAKGHHMWTKEEIKKLLNLWNTKNIQEIATELNVTEDNVKYMSFILRKNGFALSLKRKNGYIQTLLAELKAEL